MITLYDYQTDIIRNIRRKMSEKHKHIIVQSPTGSGKTVIFSYIVSEMTRKKKRALILTDRIELLTETGGTLEEFNLKPYKITAGQMVPPPRYYDCYIAMAQTLKNRIEAKHYAKDWQLFFKSFDLIIIDEAHKQEFNCFFYDDPESGESRNVFNGAYILGFTATPQRSGKQRQLAQDYSTIVLGPTVQELITKGKLVEDRYYGVEGINTSGVKIDKKTGDFDESAIYNRFNKPELYAGVVEAWKKHTSATITICFCVNIQHTIETCKAFNEAGVKAKFVTSEVARPKPLSEHATEGQKVRYEHHLQNYNNYVEAAAKWSGDRKTVIDEWKRGEYKVLINAGILTTGFNFKAIQTVIINRATISDNLWLQMIGRGSRPYSWGYKGTDKEGNYHGEIKTHFNILDFGGHGGIGGGRLGNYRDKRNHSLLHDQGHGGGAAPQKECGAQRRPGVRPDPVTGYTIDKSGRPGCGSYINASAMICPFCGYSYDTDKELITAELKLIDYTIVPEDGRVIEKKESKFAELERKAESKGYKQGWVTAQIAFADGYPGLMEYAKLKGYSQGWAWRMAKQFRVGTPK